MEFSKGVKLKLCIHQKRHYKEIELLVNFRDLGLNVKEGDILEIYHPEEDEHQPRLLLQVPHYEEEFTVSKDSISVEQSIASAFQLRSFKDVLVNKVSPSSVALELLELTFKDQYLGRSDMWRLKQSLINTVTYINKTIEFCNNSIRCQTYEMWAEGEKVACGAITEDTKVVFRSSTCQAYLFIQMSSEMWEFDTYGDLYFEKAVNGFLAELFTKWEKTSNHEVTIVLFSRTYYKASNLDEFPLFMRECILQDYQGRFYEDFYRVVVQSERYDDWMPTLSHLRYLFHNYLDDVLHHHSHHCESETPIPEAYNSNAAQGNFLEVLNISLNVFEKHYTDRSFERTGQMSVVITPGVGLFEVDRELTNITKQRIIDNGVGSDLVCLAEQPLHAVPLLKFHKKRGSFNGNDYSMPHTWINLSFYSSKKRVPGSATFIPRIKVPQEILKLTNKVNSNLGYSFPPPISNDKHGLPNSVFDYDAYDAQVFKINSSQLNSSSYRSLQRPLARKKTTTHTSSHQAPRVILQRKLSDPDLYKTTEGMRITGGKKDPFSSILGKSPAINIPSRISDSKLCSHSFGALNLEGFVDRKLSLHSEFEDMSPSVISKIGSSGTNSPNEFHSIGKSVTSRQSRSLINPFNPSHVAIKLTSNRRRWIHTFPKGPTGHLIQQHHYQVSSTNLSDEEVEELVNPLYGKDLEGIRIKVSAESKENLSNNKQPHYPDEVKPPPMPGIFQAHAHLPGAHTRHINKHASLIWGATGEQEWNADITTGVDWKSLTLPACLPLTTDYFPDKQSLQNDYEVAAKYSRVSDSDNVFLELISQRLSQGFQLIVQPHQQSKNGIESRRPSSLMTSLLSKWGGASHEYRLSIGRVFHHLQYEDGSVDVTIYRPKYPYPPLERKYKFRFRSPYLGKYLSSWAEFKTERLENYKWNDLDSYICFRGDPRECELLKEFKYWRCRLMVLPDVFKAETKKLNECLSHVRTPCDIYHYISYEEQQNTIENYVRFMEVVHRLRKPNTCKMNWSNRERLGSVRVGDRPARSSRLPSKSSDGRIRYESWAGKEKDDASSRSNDLEDDQNEESDLRKLNCSTNLLTVVEAMKDPLNGLLFVSSSTSAALPSNTFISFDAVLWVIKRFEDIASHPSAVHYLQKFIDEGIMRHASGLRGKPFIYGFYLYSFNADLEKKNIDSLAFMNDWFEVQINPLPSKGIWLERNAKSTWLDRDSRSTWFEGDSKSMWLERDFRTLSSLESEKKYRQNLLSDAWSGEEGLYHNGYYEIDSTHKSDRYEWANFKYQSKYCPVHGFDFLLQWMCATGTLVNDTILSWQRKAANQGLHLFPVPNESFVLPFAFNSNPLRSSIVIPLKLDALFTVGKDFFSDGDFAAHSRKVQWFQECILEKFGFVRYVTVERDEPRNSFIHVTGNMIVLIGPMTRRNRPRSSSVGSCREQEERRSSDPIEQQSPKIDLLQPHFLWSFNYMLTKRWKSASSGDDFLGERILMDFREFCSDKEHRLNFHWNSMCGLSQQHSHSTPSFVDMC